MINKHILEGVSSYITIGLKDPTDWAEVNNKVFNGRLHMEETANYLPNDSFNTYTKTQKLLRKFTKRLAKINVDFATVWGLSLTMKDFDQSLPDKRRTSFEKAEERYVELYGELTDKQALLSVYQTLTNTEFIRILYYFDRFGKTVEMTPVNEDKKDNYINIFSYDDVADNLYAYDVNTEDTGVRLQWIAKLIIDTPNIKKKYNRLVVFNPIYNKKYTIGISFLSYVRTDIDSSEYNKLLKWARLIVNTQGRFIEQ